MKKIINEHTAKKLAVIHKDYFDRWLKQAGSVADLVDDIINFVQRIEQGNYSKKDALRNKKGTKRFLLEEMQELFELTCNINVYADLNHLDPLVENTKSSMEVTTAVLSYLGEKEAARVLESNLLERIENLA